jgi:O-antigen ligase/tetratricopeptide (TPR) repeat protein
MTTAAINVNLSKSKSWAIFEFILLGVCLCVVALRATITESPTIQATTLPSNVGDIVYSLSVSAVLILALAVWLLAGFLSGRFVYRFTGIELGLALFCGAATIACFTAEDKRLAIANVAMVFAVVFMAILLAQILDSRAKVRLALAVIAALGVVSAYQCAEQIFFSNQMTIEQYEQSPQTILEPMGIEPGSLQQFLFEHRLYSGGARGFFTTRNSVGSFALLACFAAAALCIAKSEEEKPHVKREAKYLAPPFRRGLPNTHLLYCGIAASAVVFGFAIIRSKGAIIGLLFGGALFVAILRFRDWLGSHRKTVLTACLSLAAAGTVVIASYGLTHGRLPGGNPMLVRWQYWQASAKMYGDHPLTGVGPGNFSQCYPRYKPAEALESVADPHNFVLSVLTEYGPLGLIGFLAMIFIPLWKVISPRRDVTPETVEHQPAFRTLAIVLLIIISAALLLIRPIAMPATSSGSFDVMIYVIVTLYVTPVFVFIVAFLLLTTPSRNTQYAIRNTNIVAPALFCAAVGLLIHNLIDFAVFEPGVFTTFWAMIACLIAEDSFQHRQRQFVLKSTPAAKIAAVVAATAIIGAYLNYALIPVAASTAKVQQANKATSDGWFELAHNLLDKAADYDPLSATASFMNGRLYLHHFETTGGRNPDLLLQAEKHLQTAIQRNKQSFKYFEHLAQVYSLLAEISPGQDKEKYLDKAFQIMSLAIERYPGCERLRFKLAQIAEQLGKTDIAVEEYKEAIRMEDSYRAQFRIMYPERKEVVSRLGQEKYAFALTRIKDLSKESRI